MILRTTADQQSLYMRKITSLLSTRPQLASYLFTPALQLRIIPLVQRCLLSVPDANDGEIVTQLVTLTRTVVDEIQQASLRQPFQADRTTDYESLLNLVGSGSSFLLVALTSSPVGLVFAMLSELYQICDPTLFPASTVLSSLSSSSSSSSSSSPETMIYLVRLLLLLHLSFATSIPFRKASMQQRASQDLVIRRHTTLFEQGIRVCTSLLSRIPHPTTRAVVINWTSELMYSFVCKWKEFYHTNEILMNSNVNASTVPSNRLVSIYGENLPQVSYYLPHFISHEAFHKLFQFLNALTFFNNYRNPQAFVAAVDFVAIAIFERIFGIAYMQRQVEKTKAEIDWRQIVELPEEVRCSLACDDWINKNSLSLVELPYVTVDSMKSSGKQEYYKSTGKTRLVFLMVY